MRWLGIVGLASWLCAACGSSDDGATQADAAAVNGCNDFVDSWCTVTTDCAVAGQVIEEGDHADEVSVCRAEAKTELGCANALALGASYDECLGDVEGLPCAGVVANLEIGEAPSLPQSCNEIIVAAQ